MGVPTSVFYNERTLLRSKFYRLRSNDAAVSTSVEKMLHCAHAASNNSILPKIKHFEHDRGLKGILQAWTKHSSILFWGPSVLLDWKTVESKVRCRDKVGLLGGRFTWSDPNRLTWLMCLALEIFLKSQYYCPQIQHRNQVIFYHYFTLTLFFALF